MLPAIELNAFTTSRWRQMCQELPKDAAEELCAEVDAYEPNDSEAAEVLALRLAARAVFGGDPPAAAELAALPSTQQTTALTAAWLALSPHPDEVRDVLDVLPFAPPSLRRYCDTLTTEQRTSLWLGLLRSGAADGLLRAAGVGGVGREAVQYVRAQASSATREPDRSAVAAQLMEAKAAVDVDNDVKKATSELADDLLTKGTAGDFRTAAEIVLWAGGAGHGYTLALRQKFTAAYTTNPKAVPKSVRDRLVGIGLLTLPKKRFRRPRFGG